MGWVSTILLVLKSIPDLIKVIKEVVDFIKDQGEEIDKKQKMKDLKNAIEESRKTGDTKKLEALFGKHFPE